MIQIHPGLYQFTQEIPQMNFTIHQYLLNAEEPVLISTGTRQQAEKNSAGDHSYPERKTSQIYSGISPGI